MTIEIIISEIDFYIIRNIREKRILAGMTQEELSIAVGASESYIGNIENPKEPQKTNHRMLAKIARELNIKVYSEIYPEKVSKNDLVRIKLKLLKKRNHQDEIDENGNVIPNMEIIHIKALSEKEILKFEQGEGRYKFRKIISAK
jgi:transcriptional regulator with XRE-family HTH domain